jgi:hypothetical protein
VRVNDPDPPLTRWSQAKPRAGRRDKPVIEPTPNGGCDQADRTAECSYRQAPDMAIPTANSKTPCDSPRMIRLPPDRIHLRTSKRPSLTGGALQIGCPLLKEPLPRLGLISTRSSFGFRQSRRTPPVHVRCRSSRRFRWPYRLRCQPRSFSPAAEPSGRQATTARAVQGSMASWSETTERMEWRKQ